MPDLIHTGCMPAAEERGNDYDDIFSGGHISSVPGDRLSCGDERVEDDGRVFRAEAGKICFEMDMGVV